MSLVVLHLRLGTPTASSRPAENIDILVKEYAQDRFVNVSLVENAGHLVGLWLGEQRTATY